MRSSTGRRLQEFHHIPVGIAAIRENSASRHFQGRRMEDHSGPEQAFVLGLTIVDFEADMTETRLGDRARRGSCLQVRISELEYLKPGALKAQQDELSSTFLYSKPRRQRFVFRPGVGSAHIRPKMLDIEPDQAIQIPRRYTDMMEPPDHEPFRFDSAGKQGWN